MSGATTAPGSARTRQTQFVLIDFLKAGSAQLIVLHHLAFYGPMSDHARTIMPALVDWLYDYARIAVQVFLVVGGFLAAKSLSPQGLPGIADPVQTIWRRYVKLAPPFIVAMLLAIAASAVAGLWMTDDSISPPPTIGQLGAHVLLLHGVLGYESLSAGAWYVAIDFQLYALTTLLLWFSGTLAGRRAPWLMPLLVAAGVGASLLYFNRDADWDVWAPYFFGSYGLGILAWWAGDPARKPGMSMGLLSLMALLATVALGVDFRSRIAVASVVAGVLFLFGRTRLTHCAGSAFKVIDALAKISFSVFLVHFPVCLVVNALFTRFVPEQAYLQTIGVLLAWSASLGAGALFQRCIEAPLGRVLGEVARRNPQAIPVMSWARATVPVRHTGVFKTRLIDR
ncbi:acyltransferase [Massilia forsythiae]|uniref:Acyltransferase n=1 Tax=Massilia forsythiae TaxID=2728020 RepID=A0A7Z2VVH0_9BURK|nr:acyltransferase [Massilia forsythiae]QJE00218.1 acyltransferase [Massilia forsythiae]